MKKCWLKTFFGKLRRRVALVGGCFSKKKKVNKKWCQVLASVVEKWGGVQVSRAGGVGGCSLGWGNLSGGCEGGEQKVKREEVECRSKGSRGKKTRVIFLKFPPPVPLSPFLSVYLSPNRFLRGGEMGSRVLKGSKV